jgi:hypothetical protein
VEKSSANGLRERFLCKDFSYCAALCYSFSLTYYLSFEPATNSAIIKMSYLLLFVAEVGDLFWVVEEFSHTKKLPFSITSSIHFIFQSFVCAYV